MTRMGIRRTTSSGNSEHSVRLVDGVIRDAKGHRGVVANLVENIGGKQARTLRVGRKISQRDPSDFGRKAWMPSDKTSSA